MKSEKLRVKNWLTQFACVSLFFILHSSFIIPNSAHAQWWTGWSQQTGLALCLHQADSTYELYSPLQTSDPIPVSKWSLQNDTLRLECASIGLKMTLVQRDSLWTGTWRQSLLKEAIARRRLSLLTASTRRLLPPTTLIPKEIKSISKAP